MWRERKSCGGLFLVCGWGFFLLEVRVGAGTKLFEFEFELVFVCLNKLVPGSFFLTMYTKLKLLEIKLCSVQSRSRLSRLINGLV